METTLNIHIDIMENIQDNTSIGNPIRYQNRDHTDQWHRFHIQLKPDEYGYFLDLRRILKMSLSLLVAIAVKKYIKAILKNKNTDNYRFQNYYLSKDVVDGIIIWRLVWGHPPVAGL